MKHWFSIPCFILLVLSIGGSTTLAGSQKHDRKNLKARMLIIGGDFDYRPYTFINERHQADGLDVEIIRRIAEMRGLSIRFHLTPWPEAIENLQTGKVDLLLGIFYTENRDRYFDFTIPHSSEAYAIFVRKGSAIDGLEDLQGKRVITLAGDAVIEKFLKPQGLLDEATLINSLPGALRILNNGGHDYVLAPFSTGMKTLDRLQEQGENPKIEVVGPPVVPSLYRFAVRKGSADLLAELNEGLDQLKTTGELKQIADRWIVHRRFVWRFEEIGRYLLIILTPVIGLIGFLLLWTWSLKKEIRKKTAHLKRTMKAAEDANLAKSRFLAQMSHEIRTPLNTILGFSRILQSDSQYYHLPDEFKRFLKNIQTSGERMAAIIGKVLDISKIEAGKFDILEEEVDLRGLGEAVYDDFMDQAIEKGVLLHYAHDSELPPSVRGDRVRLSQILTNLVDNAVKFTPPEKSVWMKIKRDENWIVFEVEDEGIGIPPHLQERIFEPFQQLENMPLSNRDRGVGLGLAIVFEIVRLMGGDLRLKSEAGKGSRITVHIPLVPSENSKNQPAFGHDWSERRFAPHNKVVVVEDDAESQDLLIAVFQKLGVQVKTMTSTRSAVETILQTQPDLVLMDLHLTPFDGLQTTRLIRQSPEGGTIPIIIVSADVLAERQEESRRAGANRFLGKPIDLDRLLPLLRQYLTPAAN